MTFQFDSQNTFFKYPFGAVSSGTAIYFRVLIRQSEPAQCSLMVLEREQTFEIPMEEKGLKDEFTIFEGRYDGLSQPGLVHYYFKVMMNNKTYYIGNSLDRLGGEHHLFDYDPYPYQITYHQPDITVPEWYTQGIMYQIFPDRFFKSGEKDFYKDREGFVEYKSWKDRPRYIKDEQGKIVYWDVFGGNLWGIIEKIPYLKSLGVSILYLNPIFLANSNHRYDTANFELVDPGLGGDEAFDGLIKACQQEGIHVILDGVFSHVGDDSIYFNKKDKFHTQGAYQSKQSPYYEWFRFEDYPDQYDCWWGNPALPNVNEMHPSYLKYIVTDENSIVKKWIKRGAKGWRLDVADELPDRFIAELKTAIKSVDNETVLLGEVWEDASNKESYGELRQYFWGNELDSVMNYPFRNAFTEFLLGQSTGQQVKRQMMSLYENYPKPYFFANMNLAGTHDTIRLLTCLGEAEMQASESPDTAFNYQLTEEKRRKGIQRVKLMAMIQGTFPGVPCIYYGDEVGMEGFADPYCRGAFPWDKENVELKSWYEQIMNYRKHSEALKQGDFTFGKCGDGYLSYFRSYGEDQLFIIINASEEAVTLDIDTWDAYDIFNNEMVGPKTEVSPMSGRLIRLAY